MTGERKPGGGKGKFPPELLLKIKEAVNIIDIVGEHVVLRKSGANYSGLCPFHSERTPSFSVSEGKQLYHCYGCKKGGDLVSFVMEIYGVTFPEAIEELAEKARIKLPTDWSGGHSDDPETERRRAAAREKQALAYKLNRFAALFYHQTLSQLPDFERYFRTRGCDSELCRNFYVGAAPASWDSLAAYLVSKQAPLPLAVELGLIMPSQKNAQRAGPGYFDLFRNRAMFPILDNRGRVAGFGGRAMPGAASPGAKSEDGPKYLNSKDSFVFQKSRLAFGLFQAQKHIREKDEVILVEGYFDVLALHAAGFENVVATCGTALTPDHLNLFRRFASRVTVLFDGDKAGVTATDRAMEIGLDHGLILHGAAMPEGLDPDEVLFDQSTGAAKSDGKERMSGILKDAKPLLDARIEAAIRYAAQGPEARTQAIKQIGSWLSRYQDPVGKEVRAQAVQEKLGISRKLIEQAAEQAGRQGPHNSQLRAPQRNSATLASPASSVPPKAAIKRLLRWEDMLLSALFRGGKFAQFFQAARGNLPPEHTFAEVFESAPAKQIIQRYQELTPDFDNLEQHLDQLMAEPLDPQIKPLLTEAAVNSEPRFTAEEVKTALDRAVSRSWARFSQQIKIAIARAEANKDAGLEARLKKEYLDVQRKLKEFSCFYDEA